MAKSGQNDFQHSVIDVVSAPIYERNFVRIMAMMAVPPDGIIYDVMPKNGLKPMFFNKYDRVDACVGFVDFELSYVNDSTEKIIFVIKQWSTLRQSSIVDVYGIYVGGTAILGEYSYQEVDDVFQHTFEADLTSKNYSIFNYLKDMYVAQSQPLLMNIPVWLAREYEPPSDEGSTTEAGTTEAGTTPPPAELALVMDYYVDWSAGIDASQIPGSEFKQMTEGETVCVKFGLTEQVSEWRKVCNATGMSVNIDSANRILNTTLTTGIITSGKTSIREPQYWMLSFGDDVYLRVYLNIHEVNYRTLGKYYLNVGQGHHEMYFRDGSIFGDLVVNGVTYDATFTPTSPPASDFWSILLELVSDPSISFEAEIHLNGYDDPYWYPCVLRYSAPDWSASFTVVPAIESNTDLWADIIINGMYISRTVDTAIYDEYVAVTFAEGEDNLLSRAGVYKITYGEVPYLLWWNKDYEEWRIVPDYDEIAETTTTEGTTTAESTTTPMPSSISILISTHIISYDSVEFASETVNRHLYKIDDDFYPEYPYYFRLKCVWKDIICYLQGLESTIQSANIYISEDGDNLPVRYGVYALSHYYVDDYGNQTRITDYDAAGNTRFCGIYGRNYLCKLSDVYLDGLTLYPAGTEFTVYYPPAQRKVLLTRANSGVVNYIEYSLSANTISFDLSTQRLGLSKDIEGFATYGLELTPGASSLLFRSKTPGLDGNGFTVQIIVTVKATAVEVIGPVDNVLKIFIPPVTTTTNLLSIYSALNPRMVVDYGVTCELTGSGEEAGDVITENIELVLGGGGDEMVVSNDPANRSVGSVFMHPGFMLNSSRRQSPIALVGIYAAYLSANYKYTGNNIDVIAIDTEEGIDLYAAIYSGDPLSRYTLVSDISPEEILYSDPYLTPDNAQCTLETTEDDITLEALESGWIGNSITFAFVWLTKEEWDELELPMGDYAFTEDVPAKAITIYVLLDSISELPHADITSDELIELLADSELISASYVGLSGNVVNDEATYYFAGGGGVSDNMMLHQNGYFIGLTETEPESGDFDIVRGISEEEKWLFAGDEVDLLAYKLKNIQIGPVISDSQISPYEWEIRCDENYAEICAMIDERKALGMMNYIDISGREIEITDITYADDNITFTTNDDGNTVIDKALLYNKGVTCNINDIYCSPQMQSDSITKATIYYGKYLPKIIVQIPNIEEWGPTLVPYYIVSLTYGTVLI